MKTQQPMRSNDEHVVLEFRPRSLARPRSPGIPLNARETVPEPNDLSRYERDLEEPDDFRHRMLANAAAGAFTIALIAVGIWLAANIARMSDTQDCVLSGRLNCAQHQMLDR
ncbi:MAG TPA: hypothetical protein VHC94_07615 [Nitrobacter sp.]|nr:hypothetical protein [Nitrobacter sp.]